MSEFTEYKKEIMDAAHSERIRVALSRAIKSYRTNTRDALRKFPHTIKMAEEVREIKSRSVAEMEKLAEQAGQAIESNKGKAYIAPCQRELDEAATIDGCGYFGRIRNVVMPMGWPAISLSIIFFFICSWNDLFTPMVLLKSMDKRTVMVALSSLIGRYTGDPPFQYAGLLMSAIPALAVYAIFQKSIVKGMSMGAIK